MQSHAHQSVRQSAAEAKWVSKRVLFVTESLGVGGAETHLINLLPALKSRGFEVAAFCFSEKGNRAKVLDKAGIPVTAMFGTRAAARRFTLLRHSIASVSLFGLIKKYRPSIVHFFLPGPYIAGAPVAMAAGVPIKVMSRRSLSDYQHGWPGAATVERALHARMNAVLGNSQAVANQLLQEGCAVSQVHVIYNGIVAPNINITREEARAALDIEENSFVAIVVANLFPYKGHVDLIAALARIANQMPGHWTVLCAGRDEGSYAEVRRAIDRAGLAQRIRLLGERADVPTLLKASDISILPSTSNEGFSNAVIESMAAGLPTVVTDVGGNAEAVTDGESGFVVPPKNPDALGAAILRLALNPELCRSMGGKARTRVFEHFSLAGSIEQYCSLYEKLLAQDLLGRAPARGLPSRTGLNSESSALAERTKRPSPIAPPRLLIVTESLGVGGTESHLIRLLGPVASHGWDTAVFCISQRGPRAELVEAMGIGVVEPPVANRAWKHWGRNPVKIALVANQLFWFLRRWCPAIVHFYLPAPYMLGAPLSIVAGTPIKVMSRRSLSTYQKRYPWISRIEPLLHRRMDAIIGNSRAVVDELAAEGIPSNKVRLIYNGVETSSAFPGRVQARRSLGLQPDAFVGVIVANLISYKGHTDLIEALGQISRHLSPGWRLLCAGRDEGLRPMLEKMAVELEVDKNIEYLGEYSDVPTLLAAADYSVLSSWEEGFSNVVLESMAAGLPLIVTNVGGNPEAVVDEQTGLVVPPRDAAMLGKAILRLCWDSELRERLGRAGRQRVQQEFTLERCVAAHAELYQDLWDCYHKKSYPPS